MVDNISDALIMAGAILIFIIALSVTMSSFTTVRTQIDDIIESDYKLDLIRDEHGNYMNYHTSDSDVRIVGIETVISSLYRVVKENYVVYIAGLSNSEIPTGIKTMKLSEPQYYNGHQIISTTDKVIKISISGENYNIDKLLKDNLYMKIKYKQFKEYLGVYQIATDESVADVNKTTYRVITYVAQ